LYTGSSECFSIREILGEREGRRGKSQGLGVYFCKDGGGGGWQSDFLYFGVRAYVV
jgi:hypothetical protein